VLVLSRKKNESIVINGNIVITITEIRGDKIKIGVSAPEDVKVMRKEFIEDGK
jgi:carbon storage regulator